MPWGFAIGAVGSLYAANQQKKAADKANQAVQQSSDAAIAQQNKQFEQIQALLKPFVEAGTSALGQQGALIGLGGADAQRSAIAAIQNSPEFAALNQEGQNAILQNAAATGGLRGGNTQGALAKFSPALLSELINQQYNRLGGLTSLGQNSAAGVGNAGLQVGNNISGLLQNQGNANAAQAIASGQANAGLAGQLAKIGGTYFFGGKF